MKKEWVSIKRGKFQVLCSFMSCGAINADDGIFRGPLKGFACTKPFQGFFKPPAKPVVLTMVAENFWGRKRDLGRAKRENQQLFMVFGLDFPKTLCQISSRKSVDILKIYGILLDSLA